MDLSKLPIDNFYDEWDWEYVLTNYQTTFDPGEIAEVELWHSEEGSYGPEHNAAGVFRMNDGSYVVYSGWCDTSGWDCQSGARFTTHTTKQDAINLGLGDEERGWFGIDNMRIEFVR